MRRLLLIWCILLFGPVYLSAQGIPVRRFTVQDGLAQSQITSLVQDARGFLWVGTQAGLSRWDGLRFRTWTTREDLPDDVVTALAVDAQNTLWIGTDSGALAALPEHVNQRSPSKVFQGDAAVNALMPMDNERFMLGSAEGLFQIGEGGDYRDQAGVASGGSDGRELSQVALGLTQNTSI